MSVVTGLWINEICCELTKQRRRSLLLRTKLYRARLLRRSLQIVLPLHIKILTTDHAEPFEVGSVVEAAEARSFLVRQAVI